jgi:hypothetical protein
MKFPPSFIKDDRYVIAIKTVIDVDNGTDVRIKPNPELKFKAATELIVVAVGPVPLGMRWYPLPARSFHCVTLLPLSV